MSSKYYNGNLKFSLMTFPTIRDIMRKKIKLDELFDAVKRNHLTYVDMNMAEIKMYGEKKVIAALEKSCLHLGCLISYIPMSKINNNKVIKMIDKSIEMAKRFKCKKVMIVPMGKFEVFLLRKRDKEILAQNYIHNYKIAVERANRDNITVCFEDAPTCLIPLSSTEECKRILQEVPGLKLVFDTANMLPGGSETMQFYEELKNYICHVHLKDVKYVEKSTDKCIDGRYITSCLWGSGIIPVKEIAKRLEEDGFGELIGIEYTEPNEHSLAAHESHIAEFMTYLN